MKRTFYLFFIFTIILLQPVVSQPDTTEERYEKAFQSLKSMLEGKEKMSFKKAVFITENAYLDNQLNFLQYNTYIKRMAGMSIGYMQANPQILVDYKKADKDTVLLYGSIFKIFTDTVQAYIGDSLYDHIPFTYDFDDIWGTNDWTKMFVSHLMKTRKGNCHSMPYLYKIVAEELGLPAYLSFAPNHMYIKYRALQGGWYNLELTSGTFPTDSWLVSSGYIGIEAIRNKIYLDSLGDKESVAQCLTDLAQGYQRKLNTNNTDFVLKCCNLSLQYFPHNVNTLMLKAETLKRKIEYKNEKATYKEMEKCYVKLYQLGYKTMPKQVYATWLNGLKIQKQKN